MVMTLQILQVGLFAIPVIVLLILGLVILLRPVSAINRYWLLFTFLPMLVANLLAIVMNDIQNGIVTLSDWRFWAIVVVDLTLAVGISIWLRGVALYGLTLTTAETLLMESFKAQGFKVVAEIGEKRTLLASVPQATILTVTHEDREDFVWLTFRAGEVVVRADSGQGMALLRKALPTVRAHQTSYVFQAHAMGILYLVLAVVLLVFGWIYFFEPRLLLTE